MDQKLKQILDEELKVLDQEIANPEILVSHILVFTDMDKQRVRSEAKISPIHGTHELINRLQKRGEDAFPQFLKALRKEDMRQTADKLELKRKKAFPNSTSHSGVLDRGKFSF